MELSAKEKYIAELKDHYKRKTSEELNTLKQKYPNAMAPFTNKYANYLLHVYISLTLIDSFGATAEALIDGGAKNIVNGLINLFFVLLSVMGV